MKRSKKMNFLSESILLEESGLPKINTIIIVSVTALIVLFLVWANMLIMEESVAIDGQVILYDLGNKPIAFLGFVRTSDLVQISLGSDVYIDIPGVTSRQSLNGMVIEIDISPHYDTQNNAYYEVLIELNESDDKVDELSSILVTGMESQLKVITGSRTMLQYLLGTLYDTGRGAFNIK